MPEFVQPTIWNLHNTAAGIQSLIPSLGRTFIIMVR